MRFLQVLGRLYNSFGIQGQSTGKSQVSLPDVASNVSFVSDNIKKTISEVKQKHGMKEATATNGPEGTVSNKTQVSHQEQGMRRLHESIATTNNEYLEEVELSTLLTTVVENIHANSHFKHETFTALPYSQDFGTITKESLKRITKWGAKYFTHYKSYYHVPKTTMDFGSIKFMQPLTSAETSAEMENAMKELVEKYRPVRTKNSNGARRQRTKQGLYHQRCIRCHQIAVKYTLWQTKRAIPSRKIKVK